MTRLILAYLLMFFPFCKGFFSVRYAQTLKVSSDCGLPLVLYYLVLTDGLFSLVVFSLLFLIKWHIQIKVWNLIRVLKSMLYSCYCGVAM